MSSELPGIVRAQRWNCWQETVERKKPSLEQVSAKDESQVSLGLSVAARGRCEARGYAMTAVAAARMVPMRRVACIALDKST